MMEPDRKRNRSPIGPMEPMVAWKRLVMKVMFVTSRVTSLALRVIQGSPVPPAPSTPRRSTTMSFDLISQSPSQTRSPVSSMGGQEMITDHILREVGPPLRCEHGETMKLFICQKQGPNLHRLFWRCPMSRTKQCKAFVWCERQPYLDQKYHYGLEIEENQMSSQASSSRTSPTEQLIMEAQRRCPHSSVSKSGTNAFRKM